MQPRPSLRSALMVIASAPTRRMYADYLGWRGVTVREVTTVNAALDYLSAFTPDAAVIENRLDDGTGLDLVRTLRRRRATALLPIALLSSDVFSIDLDRARACGCDTLLNVPCLPEAMFLTLAQLVDDRAAAPPPPQPPPDTWLFANGSDSVMITRADDCDLHISGPGAKRRSFSFRSELELVRFQVRYERRLVHAGFLLEGFRSDRRAVTRRRTRRRTERRAP